MNPSTPVTPSPETPAPQPGEAISAEAKQAANLCANHVETGIIYEVGATRIQYVKEVFSWFIQRAITTARAADAQRIAELERERNEHMERSEAWTEIWTVLKYADPEICNRANQGIKCARISVENLRTELADARAQVKQSAADTERLDWLERDKSLKTLWGTRINLKHWEPVVWDVRQGIDQSRDSTSPGSSGDGTTEPSGRSACDPSGSGPINPTA